MPSDVAANPDHPSLSQGLRSLGLCRGWAEYGELRLRGKEGSQKFPQPLCISWEEGSSFLCPHPSMSPSLAVTQAQGDLLCAILGQRMGSGRACRSHGEEQGNPSHFSHLSIVHRTPSRGSPLPSGQGQTPPPGTPGSPHIGSAGQPGPSAAP